MIIYTRYLHSIDYSTYNHPFLSLCILPQPASLRMEEQQVVDEQAGPGKLSSYVPKRSISSRCSGFAIYVLFEDLKIPAKGLK